MTIALLWALPTSTTMALSPSPTPSACDIALERCDTYAKSLGTLNGMYKEHIQLLQDQRDEALNKLSQESQPLLPGWVWALVGASGGLLLGRIVK